MVSEAWYSELCQTFKVEYFVKIVNNLKMLAIFVKCSILDVLQGSEYTPGFDLKVI